MDETKTQDVARPESKSPRKRTAIFLLLLAGCGAGYWIGSGATSAPLINGGLAVDDKGLDFGNIWERDQVTWKFPIRNEHNRDIDVVGFATTCSCVAIEPRSFCFASVESGRILRPG